MEVSDSLAAGGVARMQSTLADEWKAARRGEGERHLVGSCHSRRLHSIHIISSTDECLLLCRHSDRRPNLVSQF